MNAWILIVMTAGILFGVNYLFPIHLVRAIMMFVEPARNFEALKGEVLK